MCTWSQGWWMARCAFTALGQQQQHVSHGVIMRSLRSAAAAAPSKLGHRAPTYFCMFFLYVAQWWQGSGIISPAQTTSGV